MSANHLRDAETHLAAASCSEGPMRVLYLAGARASLAVARAELERLEMGLAVQERAVEGK